MVKLIIFDYMMQSTKETTNDFSRKAELLMETLPYMKRYDNKIIVVTKEATLPGILVNLPIPHKVTNKKLILLIIFN